MRFYITSSISEEQHKTATYTHEGAAVADTNHTCQTLQAELFQQPIAIITNPSFKCFHSKYSNLIQLN